MELIDRLFNPEQQALTPGQRAIVWAIAVASALLLVALGIGRLLGYVQ